MISLIESLFGISVPKWVIELVLAALVLGAGALYLEHRGATHELAKLQKSSAALVARVTRQNAETTAQYQAAVKANEEKLNEATAANAALQSDLARRVREFETYRSQHASLARPAGPSAAAPSGECGARSCGELASELAVRGNELAGSVGEVSAALQSCQRDRDSLTGEPR